MATRASPALSRRTGRPCHPSPGARVQSIASRRPGARTVRVTASPRLSAYALALSLTGATAVSRAPIGCQSAEAAPRSGPAVTSSAAPAASTQPPCRCRCRSRWLTGSSTAPPRARTSSARERSAAPISSSLVPGAARSSRPVNAPVRQAPSCSSTRATPPAVCAVRSRRHRQATSPAAIDAASHAAGTQNGPRIRSSLASQADRPSAPSTAPAMSPPRPSRARPASGRASDSSASRVATGVIRRNPRRRPPDSRPCAAPPPGLQAGPCERRDPPTRRPGPTDSCSRRQGARR